MKRRDFISLTAKASAIAPFIFSKNSFASSRKYKKVIVLGLDGMEPKLAQKFMDEGKLPNFNRAKNLGGYFGNLGTTLPALSPVAWSSFITGVNPGRHGIFDFIHRNPSDLAPFLSTSMVDPSGVSLKLGGLQVPLWGGGVKSMRGAVPLWDYLAEAKIPSFWYRLPGNYPVPESPYTKSLSGMGTPALAGDYGVACIVTEGMPSEVKSAGLRTIKAPIKSSKINFDLEGPANPFSTDTSPLKSGVSVLKDTQEKAVVIEVDGNKFLVAEGEWSPWIEVPFKTAIQSISGIVKFFVRKVHPNLELYVSPVCINPKNAASPISTPSSYSKDLSNEVGLFNTLGLPADTKSLSNGTLSDEEYFDQAVSVLEENEKAFYWEFPQFKEGVFFFYFSSLDQNSHMLWRCMDENHPLHDPKSAPKLKLAVQWLYQEMDKILGEVLNHLDSDTLLLVMSDHGFAPFTRELQLNTWLLEEGYLRLNSNDRSGNYFANVDWDSTKAYAVGFSGLFINKIGREKNGIVSEYASQKLLKEISEKLSKAVDPLTGRTFVRGVPKEEVFHGDKLQYSPDILCAYDLGYRVADESILGEILDVTVRPRTDKWSADHCMSPEHVPGILISNSEISKPAPHITDLAPTILNAFGVPFGSEAFDGIKLV